MLYVKNQELTEYVGGMVNITCLSDMYGGDMRHTEMCIGDLEVLHCKIFLCLCLSYSVCCGSVANKSATYRDPRYMCRDQLNYVFIC